MKIVINGKKEIEIVPRHLVVKEGKLFNLMTSQYEAIDGDRIEFTTLNSQGKEYTVSGFVKNYTCDRRIEIHGAVELYAMVSGGEKKIEHLSKITETDCKYEEELAEEEKKKNELEFAEMEL